MLLIIIAIIIVGIAEFWLYRKYTSGGIPLVVAIIVTQIAAVALWRIIGPFGFLSRTGLLLLALSAVIVAVFWLIAIRYNRRHQRRRPSPSRQLSEDADP